MRHPVCEKKVLTPVLLLTKAVGLEGFAVFSVGIQNSKSFLFKHTRMNHLFGNHFVLKVRFIQKSIGESQFLFQFVRNYY